MPSRPRNVAPQAFAAHRGKRGWNALAAASAAILAPWAAHSSAQEPSALEQPGQEPPALAAVPFQQASTAAFPAGMTMEQFEAIVDKAVEKKQAEAAAKKADEWIQTDLDLNTAAPKWGPRDGHLTFESKDKSFGMHIGGRTQMDTVFLQGPADVAAGLDPTNVGFRDAVLFRRGRFRMEGRMWETTEFLMEYDFFNSFNDAGATAQPNGIATTPIETVAPLDLHATWRNLPVFQTIRLGLQKEGIGLEHIQSSRWLEFMERSYNNDGAYSPFANGYSPGVTCFLKDEAEVWGVQTGIYKNTVNPWQFGISDGNYSSTTRFTWLPIYDEASDGRYMLHFGTSISVRGQSNDLLRQRVRGSMRNAPASLAPAHVNSGNLLAGEQTLVNQEFAFVHGAWQVSGEYYVSVANDATAAAGARPYLGDYQTHGGYLQALYFLTGEHRAWDKFSGVFTRVVPHTNAWAIQDPSGCRTFGSGAWQVGARYQFQDFDAYEVGPTTSAGNIFGGQLHGVDLAVNWYMNPNMHMLFNYAYQHRNAPGDSFDGPVDGFGVRWAIDF